MTLSRHPRRQAMPTRINETTTRASVDRAQRRIIELPVVESAQQLCNWDSTAIYHMLRSGDGACTRGGQEFDEVCDLAWSFDSTNGISPSESNDDLPGAFRVDALLRSGP